MNPRRLPELILQREARMEGTQKMRKRIVRHAPSPAATGGWLDLEKSASVEVTSEDDALSIEAGLFLP
jgi:hypothetical protein